MPKGIVYQNKDVVFKILRETYKEKSFRAYGLDLPRIETVLLINPPVISADEPLRLQTDKIFRTDSLVSDRWSASVLTC